MDRRQSKTLRFLESVAETSTLLNPLLRSEVKADISKEGPFVVTSQFTQSVSAVIFAKRHRMRILRVPDEGTEGDFLTFIHPEPNPTLFGWNPFVDERDWAVVLVQQSFGDCARVLYTARHNQSVFTGEEVDFAKKSYFFSFNAMMHVGFQSRKFPFVYRSALRSLYEYGDVAPPSLREQLERRQSEDQTT